MIVPLLLGGVGGLGVWLFWVGFKPKPKPLLVLLKQLEQPATQTPPSLLGESFGRVLGSVSGSINTELAQDLAMLDRTMADHTRSKIRNAGLLAGLPLGAGLLATAGGVNVPTVLLVAVIAAAGLTGWLITDNVTRSQAALARAEFRSTLVTYLQLVATLLAGGAGTNEALQRVTHFGEGRGFTEISHALTEARLRGVSPWVTFAQIAQRKGLSELDELAAAVELAGTSGARVRTSLMTKATSLRHAEMMYMKGQAEAASESMGIPIGFLMLSFVLLVGFPAMVVIMGI